MQLQFKLLKRKVLQFIWCTADLNAHYGLYNRVSVTPHAVSTILHCWYIVLLTPNIRHVSKCPPTNWPLITFSEHTDVWRGSVGLVSPESVMFTLSFPSVSHMLTHTGLGVVCQPPSDLSKVSLKRLKLSLMRKVKRWRCKSENQRRFFFFLWFNSRIQSDDRGESSCWYLLLAD